MGLLSKATFIGGIVALANTAKGREYVAKAKAMINDPATRAKLMSAKDRVVGQFSGTGNR